MLKTLKLLNLPLLRLATAAIKMLKMFATNRIIHAAYEVLLPPNLNLSELPQ